MDNLLKKGIILATLSLFIMLQIVSCGGGSDSDTMQPQGEAPTPLNITILLDLSDRITKPDKSENTKNLQYERDSMLLMNIQKSFYNNQTPNGKFKAIGNKIKVICYPHPQDESCLSNMKIDMGISDAGEINNKKALLMAMDTVWNSGINHLYNQAREEVRKDKNYPGSDIWSFFNGPAEVECIDEGFRNILLILTDGYIYHKNSWHKNGNVCRGILSNTLEKQTSIESVCNKYDNLEVMFLEINPENGTPDEFNKIQTLLTDWCTNMGIQNVKVVQTNSPTTTIQYINKFIGW